MKVTIYDPVEEDIEEATKWFNEKRPELGDEFATEVRRALEFIERTPLAAPPFSPRYRVKMLKRFQVRHLLRSPRFRHFCGIDQRLAPTSWTLGRPIAVS